jgi:cytochrome c oxidase subunit 2
MKDRPDSKKGRRVIIASANLLFARGLEKILRQQAGAEGVEILQTRSLEATFGELEKWIPDTIIVDYDDRTIDRSLFLRYFMDGDRPLQVMLVSLAASGAIVVYDRHTINPDQFEEWLHFSAHPAE